MLKCLLSIFTIGMFATSPLYAKGKQYSYVIKPFGAAPASNTSLRPSKSQKKYMEEQNYNYSPVNNYSPNINFSPGIAFNIGGFGLSIGNLTDTSKMENDEGHRIGKTSAKDYSVSWFSKGHGISIFEQTYKGLYLGNPETYGTPAEISQDYPRSDEWNRHTSSVTFYYLLNDNGFSMPALLNQTEQIQSGFSYSFILTAGGSLNSLSGLGTPILHSTQQSFYPESSNLESVELRELNTTFGLGMSQTLFDFYLALYVGVGPSQQEVTLKYLNSPSDTESSLSYAGNGLFAIGYGGETFFIGMFMHYEAAQSKTSEMEIDFSRGSRETFIGIRF